MSLHKSYIIAVLKHALAEEIGIENLGIDEDQRLQNPGEPAIAPPDDVSFPDEVMVKLEEYKANSLLIDTFESWIEYLEHVAANIGISPALDLDKLAAILNRYRIEHDREPL